MPTEATKPNPLKKIGRIFLKAILFLLLFIVVIFLLILTPPVQKFATHKVAGYLQNKLKTRVEIGSIGFGLTGNIHLNDIFIEDQTKDTLISGGSIKANVSLFKLFSNEVEVKDLELQNITAKIKRVLPDTAFNFQFIVNAFASEKTKAPDTAKTAPLKLAIYTLGLDNINLVYKDVVTGNDMRAHIGGMKAKIDSLDIYQQHFTIPLIDASNVTAVVNQTKPLVAPKPLAQDTAAANAPSTMQLNLGTINLNKVNVQYGDEVSAFYTLFNIGQLTMNSKQIDLQNEVVRLNNITLNNSVTAVRFGKVPQAQATAKEVVQQVQAQATVNWSVRVDNVDFNNNQVQYDDDSKPRAAYGMDYFHIKSDSLTLHIKNVIYNTDSIALAITKGSMREQSGFVLNELQGDILYASKQAYIKNLYLKTPGTELKKDVVLQYPSYKALTDTLSKVQMDINIPDSYVQVKDILVFAPQFRSQRAFANPNAVWHMNLQANGNMDRLHVAKLDFQGLSNTQIVAAGTLTGLNNPKNAGGDFVIQKFHTSQSDIATFTGQRLSNASMNLPETFDINGTIAGNAGALRTNLNLYTSDGGLTLDGQFADLTNPSLTKYNATIRTNGLHVGSILRNRDIGSISAVFSASGQGFTPKTINTKFKGTVYNAGYNNYVYKNVNINGSLNKTVFNVNADVKDPNIYLTATASGNFDSAASNYKLVASVDSVKTLPLHFTTTPFIFRGQINADIPSADPNNLVADVLITKALFVSDTNRLQLDTLELVSGHTDAAQYLRLRSSIINAQLQGQYRLTDLGSIFLNNIEPYISVSPYKAATVQPYDFTFSMDISNSPALATFVQGLNVAQPIHADGHLATAQGLQATLTAPHLIYGTNDISNLIVKANTDAAGLHLNTNVKHLKSGSSFDIYNTQFNATALNHIINFALNVNDQHDKDKYFLSGTLTQPDTSRYSLHLNPDSLLLNYEKWTVAADNLITIHGSDITAKDFILQQLTQQLAIQSIAGTGNPLNVSFKDFKLATITGFIKSDSLLVDGLLNGTVTLKDLATQPVFVSDLTINDLSMRQDTIGNINLKVANTAADRYDANITLSGRGNDMAITGFFGPQGNDMALNLDVAIRQIQLSTMNGALASAIKNATGTLNGNVAVRGTTSAPKVNGDLNFNKAVFNTVFLGGDLKLDQQKISVTEDGFQFNNFTIRDSANNPFAINGTVQTDNFINYNFNLDVTANDFRAINTTKKDNKLYYGKLYLSTNLHIGGTESSPIVDGGVTINDKTNFSVVIPQDEPGVVSRKGIVEFVNLSAPENDSLFMKAYDTLKKSTLLGYNISTNITISKNANFNIIVDEANGDFLNVKGEGLLNAGIDPSGKITMTGTYTLDEGAYELSFNLVHRRFTIQSGSTITWLGDPTSADLNVTAIYVASTAPLDLVQDQIDASNASLRNTYLQKLPFEVHLVIGGQIMKPDINFDIALPPNKSYNVSRDIVTEVNAVLTQLRQEPSELDKQAFALLLLGRFVGQNPFQSSNSGGGFSAASFARQSVSKILTDQLNQLASGLIHGVDLNFDVASTDDYTSGERQDRTDLNVGLTKRLLNNRLSVTVGSNVQLEGPQAANQSSSFAGNININYQLSKDGRYMLRAYRKNDYEGQIDGYVIETGVGFSIVLDYNKFSEILRKKKVERSTEQNQTNPKNGD